jgi:hypothetical protein
MISDGNSKVGLPLFFLTEQALCLSSGRGQYGSCAETSTSQRQPTDGTTSNHAIFSITSAILNKLLIALNECSEQGQIAILNALARYEAQDKESEHICERVVP